MNRLTDIDCKEKRVLVRMDLDVPQGDYSRIESAMPTLDYLLSQNAKIILMGHMGRPDGQVNGEFSHIKIVEPLKQIVGREVDFFYATLGQEVSDKVHAMQSGQIILLENLRFDRREEENDEGFARELASLADIYVNEAFAVSHRAHASIVGVPKFLPHTAGMRMTQEIEMLSKVIENPDHPTLILISGIKDDKLKMVSNMETLFDTVLVAGRLPEYIEQKEAETGSFPFGEHVIVAKLNPDKEDITINTIEKFEKQISEAKTIVLAGVIGKVEDEGHQQGTRRVFEAVANANAFKLAGGGDTEAALTKFGLTEKFTWISVGGGAMLEYLANKSLPGIESLM